MMYSIMGSGIEHMDDSGLGAWEGYSEGDDPSATIQAPEYTDEECPECVQDIDTDGDGHDEECDTPDWKPEIGMAAHFNHAGVSVEDDHVDVHISVGDPRGAFVMRLEYVEGANHPLRLSVPTPWDPMGHAGLEPLASPGYYAVGGGSNPSDAPGPREVRRLVEAVQAFEGLGWREDQLDPAEARVWRMLTSAAAPFNRES